MLKFRIWLIIIIVFKLLIILFLSYTSYGNKNVNKFIPEQHYEINLWESRLPLKNQEEIIYSIIKEFNVHYPNINVILTIISPLEIEAQLDDSLTLGNPPHIVSFPFSVKYKDNKFLIPIELSDEERNQFSPYSLEYSLSDNQCWYLPRWTHPRLLAVNKAYFKKSGMDIDLIRKIGWKENDFTDLLNKSLPSGSGMPKEHIGLYPSIEVDEFLAQWKTYEITKKENLYRDFLDNAFGIVGPVGPEFFKKAGENYAALPFPHSSLSPVLVGHIDGLMFFGQYPLKRQDELEAAQIFGLYYSYYSSQIFSPLLDKVPVYIDLVPNVFMDIENYIILPLSHLD